MVKFDKFLSFVPGCPLKDLMGEDWDKEKCLLPALKHLPMIFFESHQLLICYSGILLFWQKSKRWSESELHKFWGRSELPSILCSLCSFSSVFLLKVFPHKDLRFGLEASKSCEKKLRAKLNYFSGSYLSWC